MNAMPLPPSARAVAAGTPTLRDTAGINAMVKMLCRPVHRLVFTTVPHPSANRLIDLHWA